MVKLKNKISAFTLLESMVAIVIVMIVFSLASIVIINVSSTGITREKQNAYALMKSLRNETLQQGRFFDETIEFNELILEKQVLDYKKKEALRVLLIEVFKGKKKLFENRELILVETDQ